MRTLRLPFTSIVQYESINQFLESKYTCHETRFVSHHHRSVMNFSRHTRDQGDGIGSKSGSSNE
ncbi:hypothetical protein BLOT_014158, partial [Blomia tropicalis]